MTLHALDALGDAITATREYRPRGLGEWLWVAFVAILVGTPGIGLPTGGAGCTGTGGEFSPQQPSEFPGEIPQAVLEVLAVIVAALIVVWVLLLLVGAMLEFPFLAWLRDGEVDTLAEIRTHLGQALGLAVFRLVVGLVGFALVAGLLVASVGTGGTPTEYLLGAADLGVVLGLLGIPTSLVTAFTTAFVVPTMRLEDTGVVGGWRRFWSTLAGAPKQFLAYAVAVAVLAYIGGLLVVIAAFLAMIPAVIVGGILGVVVGFGLGATAGIVVVAAFGGLAFTVVALAVYALVQVFLRYYALFVLGAIDEELDFAPERRRAVGSGDDADDGPERAGGTDDPQVDPQ
jgi:hypothetical protein